MIERLCGPACPTPNAPHRDPEPDWIGNMPVEHGESDYMVPGTGGWNGLYTESREAYCLCGHPVYWLCPGWLNGGGIGGWTIGRGPDGAIHTLRRLLVDCAEWLKDIPLPPDEESA